MMCLVMLIPLKLLLLLRRREGRRVFHAHRAAEWTIKLVWQLMGSACFAADEAADEAARACCESELRNPRSESGM